MQESLRNPRTQSQHTLQRLLGKAIRLLARSRGTVRVQEQGAQHIKGREYSGWWQYRNGLQ